LASCEHFWHPFVSRCDRKNGVKAPTALAVSLLSLGVGAGCTDASNSSETTATTQSPLTVVAGPRSVSYDFADLPQIPAGVAGDADVVFVGDPLEGQVLVFSRLTGRQIAKLPPPPSAFVLPFIMHTFGNGHVAILDAGGLPTPKPFTAANPRIYEYDYHVDAFAKFSATLVRTISFANELVGFSEDIVRLDDGEYLLTDSVLGSIWRVRTDGTVVAGIVPKTLEYESPDAIPQLVFCPTMPEVTVNGFPFLFSGSTIPGVSPIAVRDGTVYFFSPCARGLFSFPLEILFDSRPAYKRASDIHLIASTPPDVKVEELLDFAFNPYDPLDRYLYAAHPMQLQVIRIDVSNGARQVVADGSKLFDFPSSLGFLPPVLGISPLMVVSNQQERTTLTNDAITSDQFNLPFIVAKVLVTE